MEQTTQKLLDALREKTGHAPRASNGGWMAHCPAHEDRKPSLSINEGDDSVLVHCHAGCEGRAVVEAVGLTMKDLFYAKRAPGFPDDNIKARYTYRGADGVVIAEHRRHYTGPKFTWWRPAGNGQLVKGLGDIPRPLPPYRLPELIKAVAEGKPIFLCEGERDVESIRALGHEATTNFEGGATWKKSYNRYFAGACVNIVSDNDKTGRDRVERLARELHGVAASLKVLDLGLTEEGADISDWVADHHGRADLNALVLATPEWTAPEPATGEPAKPGAVDDLNFRRSEICTDKSAARVFCEKFRSVVKWVPQWGFVYFDGRRWRRDDDGKIRQMALEVGPFFRDMAIKSHEEKDPTQFVKWILDFTRKCESANGRTESGTRIAKAQLYQAYKQWTEQEGEFCINQNRFGRYLSEKNFDSYTDGRTRYWVNLDLDATC